MPSKYENRKTNRFLITPRKLAVAVALALATSTSLVNAAGLGRLTVQSALGQPLRAEVEITSLSKEEANALSVKLATAEAFKQAGLEYNAALTSLRFAVDRRADGRSFVKITSVAPLNEPFVDLLLELNWATGKFVREYTFLLDPPELKLSRESTADTPTAPIAPAVAAPAAAESAEAAPVAAAVAPVAATPAPAAEPARPAASPSPTAAREPAGKDAAPPTRVNKPTPAEPKPRPTKPAAPTTTASADGKDVTVKQGDTLAIIAARTKPAGVSLDQAIVAIYRANPSAFFGSVHQLKAGATLTIPDEPTVAAVDATAARAEVRAKSANFSGYKARLAASAKSVPAAKAGQSASGKVGASVEDGATPKSRGDKLQLSRANEAATSDAAAKPLAGKGARAEGKVATEAAVREAQSRVSELEKNVTDLQKLVELKNKQLSDLQKQVETSKATGAAVAGAVAKPGVKPVTPAKPETPKAEAVKPEAPKADVVKPDLPKADAAKPDATKVEAPKAEAPKAELAKPDMAKPDTPKADATSGASTAADAAKPVAPMADASKPATPPRTSAAPPPVAEGGGLFDDLLGNPLVLPGLGAILALGAGYGWYAMRRRKRDEKFEDSLIAADGFTQNSLFGTTGGQNVDTHNSMFTSQRNTGTDAHSTEVDPIAEAEVYIAYGREAQAEEILREALKKQPERQAIRLKLLEIHAGRKDTQAFSTLANEMYGMTSGQNEEWPKVITLGLAIDPNNPLYTGKGGAAPAAAATQAGAPTAPGTAPSMASVVSPATLPSIPSLSPGGGSLGALGAAAAVGAAGMAAVASQSASAARSAGAAATESIGSAFASSSAAASGMASSAKTAAQKVVDEVPALDFSLDIDAEMKKTRAAAAGGGLAQAVEGKFDLPSLDLGPTDMRPMADKKSTMSSSLDALNIDLPSLESLDGGKADPSMDLSSIGLDLQPSTLTPPPSADAARWQEMATKLDLAAAYEEIGDKEGARELLQEVVKGGDSDQQQKARTMLSKIS